MADSQNPAAQETVLQEDGNNTGGYSGSSAMGRGPLGRLRLAVFGDQRRPYKEPKKCSTCKKPTRDGKDYCEEHIESQPYVKKIAKDIQERLKEVERVNRRGGRVIKPTSKNLMDLKLTLFDRPKGFSCQQLVLTMDWPEKVVKAYVRYLDRQGLVEYQTRSRLSKKSSFGDLGVLVRLKDLPNPYGS